MTCSRTPTLGSSDAAPDASATFSPEARSDLFEILSYLTEKVSPNVARKFDSEIKRVVRTLRHGPRSGAPRPEFGENVRIKMIYPYVVFYDVVEADAVRILRILHGHRNITPALVRGR